MHKRRFLAGAAAAGLWTAGPASATAPSPSRHPGLLTVSGAIGAGNRGPLDPLLDQMMAKHGIRFERAHVFDAAALQKLPAVTIEPTLEYDERPHRLRGPLLSSVLQAAGVKPGAEVMLGLRAVDGYNVMLSLADATKYRMVVATHMDGRPMALGGLGPQWAVYDADRVAPFKDQPLKQRFGLCPWGLYHIDVSATRAPASR